jgi:hypothetical protein
MPELLKAMSDLHKAAVEPDIYTAQGDRDRAIALLVLRDIKSNRLNWSPVNQPDLRILIIMGLVEMRNDAHEIAASRSPRCPRPINRRAKRRRWSIAAGAPREASQYIEALPKAYQQRPNGKPRRKRATRRRRRAAAERPSRHQGVSNRPLISMPPSPATSDCCRPPERARDR